MPIVKPLTERMTFWESPPDRHHSKRGTVRKWLGGTGSGDRIALAGVRYDPGEIERREDVQRVLGLSVREFVVAVLHDNEGRVKQRAFAEYTDWSASQVSRALTSLEDDGAIVRLRAGREKIVGLPPREETPERGIG